MENLRFESGVRLSHLKATGRVNLPILSAKTICPHRPRSSIGFTIEMDSTRTFFFRLPLVIQRLVCVA